MDGMKSIAVVDGVHKGDAVRPCLLAFAWHGIEACIASVCFSSSGCAAEMPLCNSLSKTLSGETSSSWHGAPLAACIPAQLAKSDSES